MHNDLWVLIVDDAANAVAARSGTAYFRDGRVTAIDRRDDYIRRRPLVMAKALTITAHTISAISAFLILFLTS